MMQLKWMNEWIKSYYRFLGYKILHYLLKPTDQMSYLIYHSQTYLYFDYEYQYSKSYEL